MPTKTNSRSEVKGWSGKAKKETVTRDCHDWKPVVGHYPERQGNYKDIGNRLSQFESK